MGDRVVAIDERLQRLGSADYLQEMRELNY